MVHCDDGRVSLSCCIRRHRLERLPRASGQSAGGAVLDHILQSTPALRPLLAPATLDEAWLSAGPIQPGIRRPYSAGVFVVGNAAGEAHPVVAEGISMAMQSAWLLVEQLCDDRQPNFRAALSEQAVHDRVGRAYAAQWRTAFAPRIRAASLVAYSASRPRVMSAMLPLIRTYPGLLTWGATLSGKVHQVVHPLQPSRAP
jgi:flavin-dependent dehydrogenase